jgi:hypothetical protein
MPVRDADDIAISLVLGDDVLKPTLSYQDAWNRCMRMRLLIEIEEDGETQFALTQKGVNVALCMLRTFKEMGAIIKDGEDAIN